MYTPFKDESAPINIKIPWDSNTARGFGIAVVITIIFVLLAPIMHIEAPTKPYAVTNTVPIELINFGDGDGTGLSSGNLTKEGRMHKGKDPASSLHDAQISAKTKRSSDPSDDDIERTSDLNPVTELKGETSSEGHLSGSSSKDVGAPTGDPDYA